MSDIEALDFEESFTSKDRPMMVCHDDQTNENSQNGYFTSKKGKNIDENAKNSYFSDQTSSKLEKNRKYVSEDQFNDEKSNSNPIINGIDNVDTLTTETIDGGIFVDTNSLNSLLPPEERPVHIIKNLPIEMTQTTTMSKSAIDEKALNSIEGKKSKILLVSHFTRPLNVVNLKRWINENSCGHLEDKFWIDSIKSKIIIHFDSCENAEKAAHFFCNQKWPISNPKLLGVIYISEKDIPNITLDQTLTVEQIQNKKIAQKQNNLFENVNKDNSSTKNDAFVDLQKYFFRTKTRPFLFWKESSKFRDSDKSLQASANSIVSHKIDLNENPYESTKKTVKSQNELFNQKKMSNSNLQEASHKSYSKEISCQKNNNKGEKTSLKIRNDLNNKHYPEKSLNQDSKQNKNHLQKSIKSEEYTNKESSRSKLDPQKSQNNSKYSHSSYRRHRNEDCRQEDSKIEKKNNEKRYTKVVETPKSHHNDHLPERIEIERSKNKLKKSENKANVASKNESASKRKVKLSRHLSGLMQDSPDNHMADEVNDPPPTHRNFGKSIFKKNSSFKGSEMIEFPKKDLSAEQRPNSPEYFIKNQSIVKKDKYNCHTKSTLNDSKSLHSYTSKDYKNDSDSKKSKDFN